MCWRILRNNFGIMGFELILSQSCSEFYTLLSNYRQYGQWCLLLKLPNAFHYQTVGFSCLKMNYANLGWNLPRKLCLSFSLCSGILFGDFFWVSTWGILGFQERGLGKVCCCIFFFFDCFTECCDTEVRMWHLAFLCDRDVTFPSRYSVPGTFKARLEGSGRTNLIQ